VEEAEAAGAAAVEEAEAAGAAAGLAVGDPAEAEESEMLFQVYLQWLHSPWLHLPVFTIALLTMALLTMAPLTMALLTMADDSELRFFDRCG